MRGHLPLIAMRRSGRRPDVVFFDTDPDGTRAWRTWPDNRPHLPSVQIDASDNPRTVDLRFVVGMTAFIGGSDPARVQAFAQACQEHSAGRVIALVHAFDAKGQATCTGHTDTQGGYSWPQ